MKAGIRRGMNTLDNIHKAAKKEFLDKGFQMASLRNIVKNAGVTTGAFYGYYKSKEELFDALVGKQYEHIMKSILMYRMALKSLMPIPSRRQWGKFQVIVWKICLIICMRMKMSSDIYS